MDFSNIPIDQFASNVSFALLFVWLLIDTRKEAKVREEKLTTQIEKQNQQMDRIVQSLERLENQITTLKGDK